MCVSRLVLGAILLLSMPGGLVHAATRPIVVHVIDYASVSGVFLVQAQHVVARLFGTAGIRTVWREEAAPPAALGQGHVTVIILSDDMVRHKTAADLHEVSVLGSAAQRPVSRAWIYFRRIQHAAAVSGLSSGTTLGHVIAHEVAHAIAQLPHSRCGTMKAVMNVRSTACGGFSAVEREQLHAALGQPLSTEAQSATALAHLDRRIIAMAR